MLVQEVPLGSNLTWPKPLAALAVIEPVCPVERSRMITVSPLAVSCRSTANWSPEFMNKSFVGSAVKVASVDCTGLAGACETPFLVMKAKFTGSMPTCARQVALLVCPVTGFCERLSMFNAAHHCVGSQLTPAGHGT